MTDTSNLRAATDEDLRKYFGSGNLLIGSLVRPKRSEERSSTTSIQLESATDAEAVASAEQQIKE